MSRRWAIPDGVEIGHSSFSYWIEGPSIHQSGQLEEVGRCRQKDFKKASMGRENGVVIGRFPKVEVSRGFLISGQSIVHYFALDLRIPESGRPGSDVGLRSVSLKIALSFHQALPPQIL